MNYEEAINWLNSFQQFGMKLGLERITRLCNNLGNPQNKYKIIHVGGTNGKGSVCRFIGSILTSGGYKTGIYTSPHLQRITERIVIDGREISENDFVNLIDKLKPIVEKMLNEGESPTYFEIVTAIGFEYFYNERVDYAIIEVGLGGRFDATNIVKPILSIITNVTLEHQNILGENIGDIAYEKAGIIKEGVPLITGVQGEILRVIETRAKENNSETILITEDNWKRISGDTYGQEFLIKGLLKDYDVKTKMLGMFQGKNIAIALNAIENLQLKGLYITEENIFEGIEKASFSGRMEIMQNNPTILIDGAHNIEGFKVLAETLKNDFTYNKLILVIGILSDKKISEMAEIVTPLSDMVVTTRSENKRACNPSKLKQIIYELGHNKEIVVKEKISDAIEFAKSITNKDDLICITGSLFTVGEALDNFKIS